MQFMLVSSSLLSTTTPCIHMGQSHSPIMGLRGWELEVRKREERGRE
jgi:hypothetical protein